MKLFIICALLLFLLVLWFHDFVMWARSTESKDYWWRMADFLLTTSMIIGVVILSGV